MDTRPGLARIFTGVLLIGLGALWLVTELTATTIPWDAVLPAALILVGAALMIGAGSGEHGGLLALGIVLSIAVVLSSAVTAVFDVPLAGGIGDHRIAPTRLEEEYRWGIGSVTIDLTRADLDGSEVDASLVIGELIVIVPEGAGTIAVTVSAGIGEVDLFGEAESGVAPEITTGDGAGARPSLVLVARVGIGSVEVRRG